MIMIRSLWMILPKSMQQEKFKIKPSGKKRSRSTGLDFIQMLPLKTMSLSIE
jgi:hypothetical protein